MTARHLQLELLEDRRLLSASPQTPVEHTTLVQFHAPGSPLTGSSTASGLTPSQLLQAYNINQITFSGGTVQGTGAGQTIAIVDAYNAPTITTDLAAFDTNFGLPAPPSFSVVSQTGSTTNLPVPDPQGPGTGESWALEESLDVEWSHALAPAANILLVEADSADDSDLFTADSYAANQPGVVDVSMSWGEDEYAGETAFDADMTTPNGHPGVTFIASTGDSGSPGSYPADSPNVLAVGGTTLNLNGSTYVSETAWSESGGGISQFESQPSYQKGVVSAFSTTQRTIPDVAFDADPNSGVPVYDTWDNTASTPWEQVGGTSLSAPSWAALIAIADQGRASVGLGSLNGVSQTLPILYGLPQADFHDITSGSNGGFSAGPGYDLVTGRGSPVANLLAPGLQAAPQISVSGNSQNIAAGESSPSSANGTDFGITALGGPGLTETFLLTNTGNTPLYLNGTPLVQISGADASDFTVTQPSTATLSVGEWIPFQIQFKPGASGLRTAMVSISGNISSLANPFTFAIQGTGSQWTPLANPVPSLSGSGTMLLLPDGTVMEQGGGVSSAWYKLTPDSTGNYASGTWSTLASMSTARLDYASNVLPNGDVLVLGGVYSGTSGTLNNTNTGEIYNPSTNVWTPIANYPEPTFGTGPSEVLPNGTVLVADPSSNRTFIYNPSANAWSPGPSKLDNDPSAGETWVKLPDGSILSYDAGGSAPQEAQRYVPSLNAWVDAGSAPAPLQTTGTSEVGPAVLLPDGQVFFIGASGSTALYTPSTTTTGTGSWAVGPSIPGGLGANAAPAAELPNGQVLFAAGSTPGVSGGTSLFDFDPVAGTITPVVAPGVDLSEAPNITRMLVLPSGQALFTDSTSQLDVYTPIGSPAPSSQPTISNIANNGNNSFTLSGTQLTGLSEGANDGDTAEMASNYPIIQLTDAYGRVSYARAFNWSSTGVATGSTVESVQFTIPAAGSYQVSVIANGIASASMPLIGLSVVSATPASGSTVTAPPVDFTIQFSSPYDPSSVQAGALTVNGIAASSFTLSSATSVTFHFASSPVTAAGGQTLSLAAGAVKKQSDDSLSAAFSETFGYGTLATWTGLGATPNWSNAANWQAGVAPISGDDLVFPAGAKQLVNVDDIAGLSVNSVTLAGAGYSISGPQGLTLSNAGAVTPGFMVTATTGSDVFLPNLTLASAETITVDANANLILGGTIHESTFAITFAGAGSTTLSSAAGNAISGSGGLTIGGVGVVTLASSSTYTGTTTINPGSTLNIQNATALGTSDVNIAGTLQLLNAGNVANNIISLGGTIDSIAGANVLSGTIALASSTIIEVDADELDLSGAMTAMNQTLTKLGAGTLVIDNVDGGFTDGTIALGNALGIANYAGTIELAAGGIGNGWTDPPAWLLTNGTLAATANTDIVGTVTFAANATVTLSGNFTFLSPVSLGNTGTATLDVGGGGGAAFYTPISGNANLVITGSDGGIKMLEANPDFTGAVTVTSEATLQLSSDGDLSAASSLTISGDANVRAIYYYQGSGFVGTLPIFLDEGALYFMSQTTSAITETMGPITLLGGDNQINLWNDGPLSVNGVSLTRDPGSTLDFADYNAPIGSGNNQLTFTTAPTLTGGILPYAVITGPYPAMTLDFATYGTSGVTAYTAYDTSNNLNTAPAGSNVLLTASPPPLTINKTFNAILIAGQKPVDISENGFTLTVASGLIAGGEPLAAEPFISGGTLSFGAAEGVIVEGSSITISSTITGSNPTNGLTMGRAEFPGVAVIGNVLTLSPPVANTYTGATTVGGGFFGQFYGRDALTLALGNAGAISSGSLVINDGRVSSLSSVTVSNPLVLNYGATFGAGSAYIPQPFGAMTFTGSVTLTGNTTILAGRNNITFDGSISAGSYSLALEASDADLTLNAASNYGGSTTIADNQNPGTITLGNSGALGTGPVVVTTDSDTLTNNVAINLANSIFLDGATLTLGAAGSPSLTLSGRVTPLGDNGLTGNGSSGVVLNGNIVGAGQLALSGPQAVYLDGSNAYNGLTTIQGGNVVLGSGSALGTGPINFVSGTLAATAPVTLANEATILTATTGGSQPINFGGLVALTANATLTVNAPTTFSGLLTDNGQSSSLTVRGTGTLTMPGNATTSGGVMLNSNSANSVVVTGPHSLGSGPLTLDGGTLAASGTIAIANPLILGGSVTLSGAASLNFSGAALLIANETFTANNALTTFSGAISQTGGSYGLTLNGSGVVALTNTDTYTGPTNVNSGTLSGTGSIVGSTVTVASGATIAPGLPGVPGTLSTGSVTFSPGSFLAVKLGGNNAGEFDVLNVAGSLTLNGASISAAGSSLIDGFAPSFLQSFQVVKSSGTPSGALAATAMIGGLPFAASSTVSPDGVALIYSDGIVGAVQFSVTASTTQIAGAAFTVVVTALDVNNNIATNYLGTIHFTDSDVFSGGQLPANYTFTAADHGIHTFTLGAVLVTAGNQSLTVSDAAVGLIRGSATMSVSPASLMVLTITTPASIAAGAGFGITVAGFDAYGNTVTGFNGSVVVTLANNPGNSTLGGTAAVSAFSGVAVFSNLSLNRSGTGYTLAVTAGTLASATSGGFSVTPDAATQLVITSLPSSTVTAGIGFGLIITAEDQFDNVATAFSGSVTVGLASNPGGSTLGGTTTINAVGGVAVFSGLTLDKTGSGYTLQLSTSTFTAATSSSISVTPGAATQLLITGQPPSMTTADNGFGLTVVAEDALGNVDTSFSGSVTVSIGANPGGSTLGGAVTVSASSGAATFSGLTLNLVATGYTLSATAGTFTSATSSAIAVTPGAASQLLITTQPPATATAGSEFAMTVTAEDAEGNVASGFTGSVGIGLAANPGGSILGGTTSVNATAGVAVFSDLTLNLVGTPYTLAANSDSLASATSNAIAVVPGAATQLLITTQPPANALPGVPFGFTVMAEDAEGNFASSFNGNVGAALLNNPGSGTLSGTTSVTAVNGVAVFPGLLLSNDAQGDTLQVTSSGLSPATTNAFDVAAGTLGITGTANEEVTVQFSDATDFTVSIDGGTPTAYSTSSYDKLAYNGPAGAPSEVIFSDPQNADAYTATQTLASTSLVQSGGGFEFDSNNATTLYVYVADPESSATVAVASGNSNFYAGAASPLFSYIANPLAGIYSELSGFDTETVSGSGGSTYAYVYSTSHASFSGDVHGSTFTAGGITTTLGNFSQTYVVGASDGSDNVTLHTEGGGFVGLPTFSYVSGTASGTPFLVGALYAANVTAQATNPTDTAFFYSFGGDTFNGAVGASSLTGSASGSAGFSTFVSQATGFQSVSVLESGSGTDVANLTSSGGGTFTATPTGSNLAVGGTTVVTVDTFVSSGGTLQAVPSQVNITGNANGSDTANLIDAPGNNALLGQGNTATLTTSVNTITVRQFGKVTAYQQNGTGDTVHTQAVDFALQTVGNWTSV